jgi:hypothetical protein
MHNERDASPREHPHEICSEAVIEPGDALVGPCMRDRGHDRTMMRARQRRVDLQHIRAARMQNRNTYLYA